MASKKKAEKKADKEARPKGTFLPVLAPIHHSGNEPKPKQEAGTPDAHWRKRW